MRLFITVLSMISVIAFGYALQSVLSAEEFTEVE